MRLTRGAGGEAGCSAGVAGGPTGAGPPCSPPRCSQPGQDGLPASGQGLAAEERRQAARKGCREPAAEVRLLRCQPGLPGGKHLLPSDLRPALSAHAREEAGSDLQPAGSGGSPCFCSPSPYTYVTDVPALSLSQSCPSCAWHGACSPAGLAAPHSHPITSTLL